MNRPAALLHARRVLLAAVVLLAGGCAVTPPGPPSDVVRLQAALDRLHADPRIAGFAGSELGAADAAVATLARDANHVGDVEYRQRVYLADRRVQIAEASGLARFAEQRGRDLGAERDRLLARDARRDAIDARSGALPPPVDRTPRARSRLLALQAQLPGIESRLDERGLVVRFGEFLFEPGGPVLMDAATPPLDSLAHALRADPDTRVVIEAWGLPGERSLSLQRAEAIRDYLAAHGARFAQVDTVAREGGTDRHVDVIIDAWAR
jgi:hypothetical protein